MRQAFGKQVLAGFKEGWREMVWVGEGTMVGTHSKERYAICSFCPGLLPSIHSYFSFEEIKVRRRELLNGIPQNS